MNDVQRLYKLTIQLSYLISLMTQNINVHVFSYFLFRIDIYKVVICFCLFVCPIITHEPKDKIALKFNLRNWGESGECSYISFYILSGVGQLFYENMTKIVI